MAGFTPVVVNRRSGRGLDRTQKVAIGAVAVSLAMIAIVTVQTRPGVSSPTALGMIQDMSHYDAMHAAHIKGSIPTFAQESDEIMNLTFPDERSGSDSEEYQPNAYIRGTKITFDQEAHDIIPGDYLTKDVRPTESLALKSVKRLQAKAAKAAAAAPAAQTAQKSARTSKLGMIADISTINSIHAAYIKGGIPTSSQESDEIMDVAFPDERSGSDSKEHQPSAYIRAVVHRGYLVHPG